MTIHITKDSLMDYISEIRDAFILEAEYTEEELKRLNAPEAGKTVGSSAVNETANTKDERIREYFPTQADVEEDELEMKPTAAPKRKAASILWITMGVALAAAAILLFVFLWNPDRSDVVTTTEETTTEAEIATEAETTTQAETTTEEAVKEDSLEQIKKAAIGDYIKFGSYEQDNNLENGPEAIEWLVLDREEDSLLVISRYGLDCHPYNTELADVTWGTCSLRNWLNGTFYDAAFGTQEKSLIADAAVLDDVTYDVRFTDYYKPWYSESATTDRVFILSNGETRRFLAKSEDRVCQGTAYSHAQGVSLDEDSSCWWWTRGANSGSYNNVMPFKNDGNTDSGVSVNLSITAVRPAMWINLHTDGGQEATVPAVVTPSEAPEKTAIKSNAKVGDIITFGSYEQDNDPSNGSEAIKWLVLDKVEDRALVISYYGLDSQPYNTKPKYVTWETCTLRNWLNSTFYDKAFSAEEKGAIVLSEITGGDSSSDDVPVGASTEDNVFLLSIDEAERYFKDDAFRQCSGTKYCFAQGAYRKGGNICWWWLRGPGYDSASGADVLTDGRTNSIGGEVNSRTGAVRPTMWVRLAPDGSQEETTTPLDTLAETTDSVDMNREVIIFGSYEQDNNLENGPEDIEWLVLDKQEDKVLVTSRYLLDCQAYHTKYEDVTWETCSLREWLNSTFYEAAFNPEEKNAIINALVTADANSYYDRSAGNDTTDKVFLLSIVEAERYFTDDEARPCQGTAYCYAQVPAVDDNGNCQWWLRSPGYYPTSAACVDRHGINHVGDIVDLDYYAVRPAMWIDISSIPD